MIDLHAKTIHSKSSLSTLELLKKAQQLKLSTISITDNNTVKAYYELSSVFTGRIISGIEMNSVYKGIPIKILGYNFDINKMKSLLEQFIPNYEYLIQKEYEITKLSYQQKGIEIDEIDLNNYHFNLKNSILKHTKNLMYLCDLESSSDTNDFIKKEIYNPNSNLYVDLSNILPDLNTVINIIHQCSGVALLANVYNYSNQIYDNLDEIITNYKLDGLECFHPNINREQQNNLIKISQEKKLLITGGSDYIEELFGKVLDENNINWAK